MSDAFYEGVAVYSQVLAAILFLVVMFVLWNRYVAPAVASAQARKNAELAEAEARRDKARDEIDDAQKEVRAAEEQVRTIVSRAQSDAARVAEKILSDANAEGIRAIKTADGELERGRSAARDALRADLLEKAIAIARGASAGLDAATDKRLVDETVDTAERKGA